MQGAVEEAVERLKEGVPLSMSVATHPDIFPSMVPQMIRLGEESGQMTEVFLRIGAFYSQELDYKIEALTAALEPLLLATIAFVVGFIVISIFLPLYGTLNQLG
jgi:type IV pilus assembly protein PilC